MARPKINVISLTDSEVKYLKSFMKKKKTNQTLFTRCRILLNLDEAHLPAMTYDECINACNVSRATIAKIVKLFASGGIDDVLKTNRNINSDHANRKVDGRTEARIIEIVFLLTSFDNLLIYLPVSTLTVILSLIQYKERVPEHPPGSCVLWNHGLKTMIIITDYTTTYNEELDIFC